MFIENFNKIIISELKFVLSEIPEEERTAEVLITKFSEYIGESLDKKKKKVSVKKAALTPDIRCLALKKDGDQCNGRRNNKEDPEIKLCSLHVRGGAKFGYYVENEELVETIKNEELVEKIVKPKKNTVSQDLDDLVRIIANQSEEDQIEDEKIVKPKKTKAVAPKKKNTVFQDLDELERNISSHSEEDQIEDEELSQNNYELESFSEDDDFE
jgi:hypothetical protein